MRGGGNMKKQNSLSLTIASKAKDFLKEVKKEILEEEKLAFKDFVKGAFRYSEELKKEIKTLQDDIDGIESSIEDASNGNWEGLSKIKIPARFFSEDTLRKHNKIGSSTEIRFTDLYDKSK
jgi:hypothetical protein